MSLTIVTAADRAYWRCLYQFLLSAERRDAVADHRFIAFDLGLGADKLERLARRFPWSEFRPFDFGAYPSHIGLAARTYGWKPVVIEAALAQSDDPVLWLDSATILKGALEPIETNIRTQGVMALRSAAPIGLRIHDGALASLQVPLEILHRRERVGGVVGFDPACPAARRLARDWRHWALQPEVISRSTPMAPHLQERDGRHMWEQALLSVLLLMAERRGEIILLDQDIDISCSTPVRWMSSRNKVKPGFPVWLDWLARLYYASWKFADQHAIALREWKQTRLWGLERWLREEYTIHLRDQANGQSGTVRGKGWSYYADPFLWRRDGKLYLFAEQFRYALNRARIVCLEISDDLSAGPPMPVLDLGIHASFPFLFEYRGQLYMVPETCADLYLDLFVCEHFPDRWRQARRLFYGFEAVDSVIFPWSGRWWLLTMARERSEEPLHLRIYFTDDPLTGEWQAHPVNDSRLYAGATCGSYRNAGAPLIEKDTLYRPVQMSRRFYGEGAAMMRIDTLTPTEFRESPVESDLSSLSTHHISQAGSVRAWDQRTRAVCDHTGS